LFQIWQEDCRGGQYKIPNAAGVTALLDDLFDHAKTHFEALGRLFAGDNPMVIYLLPKALTEMGVFFSANPTDGYIQR
jgi:hypothetical protein